MREGVSSEESNLYLGLIINSSQKLAIALTHSANIALHPNRKGITVTSVIVEALTQKFGEPENQKTRKPEK
ncbi:hypothetical protein GXM_10140 [Nostoc sphaeroides CCNUC1]|uniref:Uncharacterized protein n=1 Tax=Nostoc sphaeroides CCNUC1 TaxID=2653204 RepID=A0A5P8WL34_9NOSO|nr:hypothetical protein GXM_10140 [Nostoc sphaeroides CCNUC1]